MSWTAPTVRTTGDLITAAIWNTDIVANLSLLKTSIADDGRLAGEIQVYRMEPGSALTITANAITVDVSLRNAFRVLLTVNITTITVSGWTASKAATITLRLTQDGTGSRTVAFPAGWRWPGGTAPTITPTASKADIVVLYSDDGGTTIFASLFTALA